MSIDVSDLMASFAKRKCAVCGEQARVFSTGDDGDLNLCLNHARDRWPWESEVEPARGSVAL